MNVIRQARKLNYDRTLAALSARAPAALHVLNAFYGELAAIRGRVSEPVIFEMRLVWWREAIEDLAKGELRKHPLIGELSPLIEKDTLKPGELVEIIEACFGEFSRPARNFNAFLKGRKHSLKPYYRVSRGVLGTREEEADFKAFVAFDAMSLWQNLHFFKARGINLFPGPPEPDKAKTLIRAGLGAKTPYFSKLAALADWHFRQLKKTGFQPKTARKPPQSPGKFFALWRA